MHYLRITRAVVRERVQCFLVYFDFLRREGLGKKTPHFFVIHRLDFCNIEDSLYGRMILNHLLPPLFNPAKHNQ